MLRPTSIVRGDGSRLTITWEDGRVDEITAEALRAACPCAACQGRAAVPPGVTVAEVRAVGAYAIGMTFAPEGHATGIFPYDLLAELGKVPR